MAKNKAKETCGHLTLFFLCVIIRSMKKHVCDACGYVYDPKEGDPDNGVKPGTAFESIPASWVCPLCKQTKDQFYAVDAE